MTMKITLQSAVILGFLWGSLALEDHDMIKSREKRATDNDIEILAVTMENMIQELKSVKTELNHIKEENSALKTAVEAAASKNSLQLVAQQVQNLSERNKVAFSATLSTITNSHKFIGPYKTGFTLAYQNAFTNIGNAYNPDTGIFTAPVRGVYYFSYVVFNPISSMTRQYGTAVALLKNGEQVVSATDNSPGADTEDTAGNSVSILLEKGDKVYLLLWDNRVIYTDGNKRNTFSGHLLFEM